MTTAKTARWLDLIAFLLQHRFPVNRDVIFEKVLGYLDGGESSPDEIELESARRKFERDKNELKQLGVDIETVEPSAAMGDSSDFGYRLKPAGFYLPYLEMRPSHPSGERAYYGMQSITVTSEDLALLDRATRRIAERKEFPLSAAARSARNKLEFDLPVPMRSIERVLARPMTSAAEDALSVLQRGVTSRTAVACRYYTIHRDVEDDREIEPYGLFFTWGRWYCVARARDRDALRVFRVDRMGAAKLIPGKPRQFEVPADFRINEYAGRAPWELSARDPTTVRVRFAFPESRWVQAEQLGTATEPMLDDGGAIIAFRVHDRHPFLRWLLTFRRQASVLEPEDVQQDLEDLRRQVAQLYE